MTWGQDSEEMRRLLKDVVVPVLRGRGFKGTFPHFTRALPTRLDLLSFQFSQFGPNLYIEVASCAPDGYTAHDGTIIPSAKVRTHHVGKYRRRIGPQPSLDFEGISESQNSAKFATLITEAIERQGETWWEKPTSILAT
jgi:hypothetical protein